MQNFVKKTLINASGSLLASVVNRWMGSLDRQVAYYDPIVDPAYANDGKHRLYIFWHEYIQFLIYLRKNCNIGMLISKHKDADLLEQVASRFGFETVRGSTYHGNVQAILNLIKKGKRLHLTMAPDGPRGPRRTLAPGCIYLASKLQFPLVLLGIGYDRPYRVSSWDRFAIPRYGSRCRIIVSGDINIPPVLSKEMIEYYRVKVESLLNYLTEEAEHWAASFDSYENASSILDGPKHSTSYFVTPRQAIIQSETLISNLEGTPDFPLNNPSLVAPFTNPLTDLQ
ncbi:MAG: lysophospholipid acyltransferase family protein [Planctomycetia bacterium]|nr:lysophospholipid acyltransferase family protein [Planctomycetia bacterium]